MRNCDKYVCSRMKVQNLQCIGTFEIEFDIGTCVILQEVWRNVKGKGKGKLEDNCR